MVWAGPTKLHAERRGDDRPLDEDGIRQHGVDKVHFGEARVAPHLSCGVPVARAGPRGNADTADEVLKGRPPRVASR